MATIRDVARLAGVSHGTVSNVLNGNTHVGSDKVKKIQMAIKELKYQPDTKARSLRSSKSNILAVVMPNVLDSTYAQIYAGIESVVLEWGYQVVLYVTHDNSTVEEQALGEIQRQKAEGAVVITCMPDRVDMFNQLEKAGVKLFFLQRALENMNNFYFGYADNAAVVKQITAQLLGEGVTEIALLTGEQSYTSEFYSIKAYREAFEENRITVCERYLQHIRFGQEEAFKAATWWLQSSHVPAVIVTTLPSMAKGIRAAIEMFEPIQKPRVITFDNEDWMLSLTGADTDVIQVNYFGLARQAARRLFQRIESEDSLGSNANIVQQCRMPAKRADKAVSEKRINLNTNTGSPLRILLFENSASYAANTLLPLFEKKSGIRTEIDIVSYQEMFLYSIDPRISREYDITQINVGWLEEMLDNEILFPLDEVKERFAYTLCGFGPEILSRYSYRKGCLFGLPFMLDVQMLFYRKDLFSDFGLQRLYYEQTKQELAVPRTWEEYARVAAFFTKSLNPDSPTEYGTTLGGSSYYAIYELIPRVWSNNSDIFTQHQKYSFNAPLTLEALRLYIDTFRYAAPQARDWNWSQQAIDFCQGNSAMMVLYQAHFTDYQNKYSSKVENKIGVAPIPGKQTVKGGWSLGICRHTKNLEDAVEYLNWQCSRELSVAYNMLGGALPTDKAFSTPEMERLYPHLLEASKSLPYSKDMIRSEVLDISQRSFEQTASQQIHASIIGEVTPEQALANIEDYVKKFVKV